MQLEHPSLIDALSGIASPTFAAARTMQRRVRPIHRSVVHKA